MPATLSAATRAASPVDSAQKPLSAEDWHKEVASQTSFMRYSMSLFRTCAIVLAGAAVGAASFFALRNKDFINKTATRLNRILSNMDPSGAVSEITRSNRTKNHDTPIIGGIAGGFAGYVASRIVNGYKSWKMNETELDIVRQVNSRSIARSAAITDTLSRQEKVIGEIEHGMGMQNPPTQLEQAGAAKLAGNQIRME